MQLLHRVRLENDARKRLLLQVHTGIDTAQVAPELFCIHDQYKMQIEDRIFLHLQDFQEQCLLFPLDHEVCFIDYEHELDLLVQVPLRYVGVLSCWGG